MTNALLTIVLVAAAAGVTSETDSAVGATIIGAATTVAVVIARVLQQVWPSKGDNALGDIVKTSARTNRLLLKQTSAIKLLTKELAESRRDTERFERLLTEHQTREEEILSSMREVIKDCAE